MAISSGATPATSKSSGRRRRTNTAKPTAGVRQIQPGSECSNLSTVSNTSAESAAIDRLTPEVSDADADEDEDEEEEGDDVIDDGARAYTAAAAEAAAPDFPL